jgi:hypothetical protein
MRSSWKPPALVPIYLLCRDLGLLDSRTALIVINMMSNLPIAVWMLFTFFRDLPKDIIEASRIDGANLRQVLVHVLLPLVMPGIASTGLLGIILCWNEAFWGAAARLHRQLLGAAGPVLGQAVRRLRARDLANSHLRLDQPEATRQRIDLRSGEMRTKDQ